MRHISRQPNSPGYVYVSYREFMTLRIPSAGHPTRRAMSLGADSHQTHGGSDPGSPFTRREVRSAMPIPPGDVWGRLPQAVRLQVRRDIAIVIQEVLHEYIRPHQAVPPRPPGDHLHPPVQPPPSPDQPGESPGSSMPSSNAPSNSAGTRTRSGSSTRIRAGPPARPRDVTALRSS